MCRILNQKQTRRNAQANSLDFLQDNNFYLSFGCIPSVLNNNYSITPSFIYSVGGSPDDSYSSSGCYSHCDSEPKNNPEIVKASVSDFYAFIPIRYKNFELSFESGSAKFSYW